MVTEHTRIERRAATDAAAGDGVVCLQDRHYDRVRAFDRAGSDERNRVFDWSDGFARTTQWVGVVQVPGVQIEILPKVDALVAAGAGTDDEQVQYEARRNLLYMLSMSGDVPVRSRDVARLAVRQAPSRRRSPRSSRTGCARNSFSVRSVPTRNEKRTSVASRESCGSLSRRSTTPLTASGSTAATTSSPKTP